MADEYVLEVSGLEVSYDRPVLSDVTFRLAPGERLAIVGQSGSGKSTTIAAVMGLFAGSGRVTQGSVKYRGTELAGADEALYRTLRGRAIALVPQDPMSNLNPTMRVGDQIADALRTYGVVPKERITERVVALMTEAGIPEADRRRKQFPHEFSGGMRQRILIAIALAGEPDLIIADEPTSALDVTVQKQILDHLQTLVENRGTSLLFITHDLGVAADRTDTILVMENGVVVERGAPKDVLGNPQHPYTKALIAAAPSLVVKEAGPEARAGGAGGGASGAASVGSGGAGSGVAGGGAGAASPEVVLEVRNLVKEYPLRGQRGVLRAVDDVSFVAFEGRTTAIIGESGSGKSTVAKICLGLEKATSGTVLIGGQPSEARTRAERRLLRQFTQPVFQDPYSSLNPTWSIDRIIREPLDVFGVGTRAERAARVTELLDQVALPASVAERHPGELSGGQRQRVAIARALASKPQLLVCDEAVSALDVLVQDQILRLLEDLQSELGVSCLFITHDLSVVADFAHDVVVMRKGRVVETGTVQQVIEHPAAEYTQDLIAAVPGKELLGA
ncbi:ABC transporter ATP-binding protein [Brevibacterium samyangense]|uniref:ABC transporter ATP-binding protein n=1 Tax=Brevibacterium samyangense TaxID=366888 RepID=A0ABN2T2Z4_9MICO